jgi:hypothetical protein
MTNWIRRIPLSWLIIIAAWLAVAPIFPQPHLTEKLAMLWHGELVKAIDWFDLALHSAPLVLLAVRWRLGSAAGEGT